VVEDSGPGIPDDLLATLFEPFVRGDAYAQRDGGLALPIARQLAHLMGGDLAIENPGSAASGTRFTLRLPLVHLAEAGSVVGRPENREPHLPTSALPGALLVVDADPNQRAGWATVADAAGYRAVGAGTRDEARAELRRRAESGEPVEIVIFSDHGAEEYEQIGREIAAEEGLGKPALIMLPTVGNPGDARRLREAGFRGYLVKPVAPADLRETLETLRRTRRSAWHRLFLTRHSLAESRRGADEEHGDRELEASLERLLSARTDPPVTERSV
jgi:DNA-binding response OmpR family regulator